MWKQSPAGMTGFRILFVTEQTLRRPQSGRCAPPCTHLYRRKILRVLWIHRRRSDDGQERRGHTVSPMIPALTAIEVREDLRELRGVRVKATVSLFESGDWFSEKKGRYSSRGLCVRYMYNEYVFSSSRFEDRGKRRTLWQTAGLRLILSRISSRPSSWDFFASKLSVMRL